MRNRKSLILHEKLGKSHPAWEIWKVSSCMRMSKFIFQGCLNYTVFHHVWFRVFHHVLFRVFHHVLEYFIMFRLDQIGSNLFKFDPNWSTCSNWIKLDQIGLNWIKMFQNRSIWFKLDQIGKNWFKTDPYWSNLFKHVLNGSNWFKLDPN